ncbi:response regulator [Lutibacter maritimus]|uniref:Response regulator receiver domain-containing protein n=1 Tax=Lutibacter maritimus TaxID=593133 RepID=A0A1I6R543_9FLAO|nr:response regulator [Lutibacter maritimus]SFS59809.1 Response regulator receiver domain-containing protein [Lutibacter maritimus]
MNINKLNVLLADDDEDDRWLFEQALNDIKIKTNLSLFKNGKELMDYLLQIDIKPHLIFLDLNMPIKNGMECLLEMKQDANLKNIPVAIYSTSSSEKDIENTFISGANIYINKPSNFDKLKEVIEKVLQLNWQYQTSNLNKDNFLFRI